jgi:hypothetical protein
MKHDSEDMPITCCLTSAELREREATLLAQFRSAVIETGELPDGYAFRIPGDGKRAAMIAKMIAAERECCPFLTFEFTAQPHMGPVIVRVTGPTCAKGFLKTVFCKPDAPIVQWSATEKL